MSKNFVPFYRILTVCVVIAFLLGACSQATTQAPQTAKTEESQPVAEVVQKPAPDKIKIGTAIQLSGWATGDAELAHLLDYKLWVEQQNAQGGVYVKDFDKRIPIEFITYDTESDIAKTVSLTEKLILEDKVDIVFAPWATAFTFAVAPIINQYKYPMIGTTESSTQLRDAQFPYYFGMWNPAKEVGTSVVAMLKELGIKNVVVIFVGTTYGIDQSSFMTPKLAQEGIEIKLIESYPLGATDLSPLLKKVKDLNPEALLAISYPQDAMLLQEQLMVIDFNPKLFYNSLSGYPGQRDKFGAAAVQGMLSEGAWNKNYNPESATFYDAFTKRWNREPAWDTAITWASLQMWEQVLREVGLDREKQRDYIEKTTFTTIYGKVKFAGGYFVDTGKPDSGKPPILGQWQDGIFEIVWPKEVQSKPIIFPKPAWPKQ